MIKIQTKNPDEKKYYPVRNSNSLVGLRKWASFAEKNYPEQKFIIVDNYKRHMVDKEHRDYWKARHKGGYEEKYTFWSTY